VMLTCDRCGKKWQLSDNNIGARCGIRLSAAEWCDGKLIGRAARIEALSRRLLASLPRCEHRTWDEQRLKDDVCGVPATHRDLSHADCVFAYWCDEHKTGEGLHGPASDEVEWADAARELARELGEET
jgi:ribosomal protein L37E